MPFPDTIIHCPRVSFHEDSDVAQHLRSGNSEKEVTIA
ncbi:MAG: hypothetical protein OJF50_002685 [Nitrospira sp.]|nr:hypothetical protein [Nitrospira sp.]